MFIGHYAVGLLAKKNQQLPSLAMMFIAVQLLDLIWPILVLLGIESMSIDPGNTRLTHLNFEFYPYSHSLLMAVGWAFLLGLGYFLFTKNKRGSWVLGGLVLSHWVLDFITHRPDLPLSPFTGLKVGLGLWNFPVIEITFEILLFGLGAYLYFRAAKLKRKTSYWTLITFLFAVHLMNLVGPPPPNVMAVAWSANLLWLTVLWAWWIEKK